MIQWFKACLSITKKDNRVFSMPVPYEMGAACPMVLGLLVLLSIVGLAACTHPQVGPTLTQIKSKGQLSAGVNYNSRPFAYLSADGKLRGYDIELLQELSRRLLGSAEAVNFHQVFASTRTIALNTGSLDVVAATLTITPERARLMDFSVPYFVAHQVVVVPKNSPARRLSDLQGKTILLVAGTTSEAVIKTRLPQSRFLSFPTLAEALIAFKAKQGDGLSSDDALLHGFLSENCDFRLLPETLSEEPYGLAFRKSSDSNQSDSLKNRVNKALQTMRADGTLQRLNERWILLPDRRNSCTLPQSL